MEIQSADIVLVHNQGFNLLRFITGMYWNHVFFIDKYCHADWGILESIDKGTAPGLLYEYNGAELAFYRYKNITPAQQETVLYYARTMGDFHYDFLVPIRVFFRLGLRRFFKTLVKLWNHDYPLNIPHARDSYVVCSEFAQEAYARAGLPLISDNLLLLPDDVEHCQKLSLVWRGIYPPAPDNP